MYELHRAFTGLKTENYLCKSSEVGYNLYIPQVCCFTIILRMILNSKTLLLEYTGYMVHSNIPQEMQYLRY